jgi:hypothetical protein
MKLRDVALVVFVSLAMTAPARAEDWACSPWQWAHPSPEPLSFSTVISAMGRFWGFGSSGVATSGDGLTWQRLSTDQFLAPTSVLWTGTELLGPRYSQIVASRDGVTWEVRFQENVPPPLGGGFGSIATNGSTMVAVGSMGGHPCVLCGIVENAILASSPDGVTWHDVQGVSSPDSWLSSVAWARGSFIAVGSKLLISPDGATWTARPDIQGRSVAGSNDVVIVADGTALHLSHDLAIWQTTPSPVTDGKISYVGDRFLLAGPCAACPDHEPSLWTSADGATWQRAALDAPVSLTAFASDGARLVGVGLGTAASSDGRAWQTAAVQLAGHLTDLTFDGSAWVAVGQAGEWLWSSDGFAWRRVLYGSGTPLRAVAAGPAGFLAVGDGVVVSSPDGTVATWRDAPGHANLTAIANNGSTWVAAGDTSSFFASSDGVAWTAADLSALNLAGRKVQRLVAGPGVFLALVAVPYSYDGALLASSDGRTWRLARQVEGMYGTPRSLAYGGGRFLTTDGSTVLASSDGTSWQVVNDHQALWGELSFTGDRFAAFSGRVWSTDGVAWQNTDGPLAGSTVVAAGGDLWNLLADPPGVLQRSRCGQRSTVVELPSLAHSPGLNGTTWRSDVEVHNPGAGPVLVSFATPDDRTSLDPQVFTLSPGQSRRFDDVLAEAADAGSGQVSSPIQVSSWGGRVLTAARTYNLTPSGTFGQLIPPFELDTAVTRGGEARLIELAGSALTPYSFRTNVGLLALRPTVAELELWRSDGLLLQARQLSWAGAIQLNDVLTLPGVDGVPDAFAVIRPTNPEGSVLAYASVVDNHTGDPTLVVPGRLVRPGSAAWIAGAGHVNGYNGSVWRTDLELHNPGNADAFCRLELYPWGQQGVSPTWAIVRVPPGQSVALRDVVGKDLGLRGGASVRLLPDGGPIMASARIYADQGAGSVGQLLPALGEEQAITPERPGRLLMLRQSASRSDGYRTNLGLVNATAVPSAAEVELHDATGKLLGTVIRSLGSFESTQINEVLRLVTAGAVDDAVAVVRTPTPGATLLTYASLVDNRTNDPLLITAQLDGTAAPDARSNGR